MFVLKYFIIETTWNTAVFQKKNGSWPKKWCSAAKRERHVSRKGKVTPTFKPVSQSILHVTSSSLLSIIYAHCVNHWGIQRTWITFLELALGLNKQRSQPGSQQNGENFVETNLSWRPLCASEEEEEWSWTWNVFTKAVQKKRPSKWKINS